MEKRNFGALCMAIEIICSISAIMQVYPFFQSVGKMRAPTPFSSVVSLKDKAKTYEFNYKHRYPGLYSVNLCIDRSGQWSPEKDNEIRDSFTFKVAAKLYNKNNEISNAVITNKDLYYSTGDQYFKLAWYEYKNKEPNNYKLVLTILEPEKSSFYKTAKVIVELRGDEWEAAQYAAVWHVILFIIFSTIALFCFLKGRNFITSSSTSK